MNHWRRAGESMDRLAALLPTRVDGPTYPSRLPTLPFDRILASPHLALMDHGVVRTEGTRVTSDHLPLMARFVFREDP
jgi:endonuclease/exonuclease/phosphatase family metal-dependent hydrolase